MLPVNVFNVDAAGVRRVPVIVKKMFVPKFEIFALEIVVRSVPVKPGDRASSPEKG
jgi:hypothetical protein